MKHQNYILTMLEKSQSEQLTTLLIKDTESLTL